MPTIDEMLTWLGGADQSEYSFAEQRQTRDAIRAILEQHRTCQIHIREKDNYICQLEREGVKGELDAIRAFVERVKRRRIEMDQYATELEWWKDAIDAELAAMEKENARTND